MTDAKQPTKRDESTLMTPEQVALLPKQQRNRDPFADVVSERRVRKRGSRAVSSRPYAQGSVPTKARGARHARKPERSTGRLFISLLMHLVAVLLRIAALALCAIVVAGAFPFVSTRLRLTYLVNFVNPLIPDFISGLVVFQTPFGGAFRGDFAFAALVLFILDWICMKVAARYRD